MAAKIVFHPGASDNYAAAFAWYYPRGTAIAPAFEREIERGLRLIIKNDGPLARAPSHGIVVENVR